MISNTFGIDQRDRTELEIAQKTSSCPEGMWMVEGENPPIGIILCASKNETLVKYALDGLPNRVIAAEYRTVLPSESDLVTEIEETRRRIESRSKDR